MVPSEEKIVSLRDKAAEVGLPYTTVWTRINRYGWTEADALSTPVREAKFPSDDPQYFRKRHLWKNYGMLLEEYEQKLANQGGCCAICGLAEEKFWARDGTGFVVDHDHATDENRGILCHGCNVGLGLYKENATALRAAAAYLERYKK